MDTIPIQSLAPETSPPADGSIRAIVTLSWPYSSSTKQCALLLADPDFRLRSQKGQVRVRFTGPSAEAVARSHVGIGATVLLRLTGAAWAQDAQIARTPGRSVDGELVFNRKLELTASGADGEVNVSLDEPMPAPSPELRPSTPAATPVSEAMSQLRSSLNGTMESIPIYSSPAFSKRLRLSGQFLPDLAFDPFVDDELRTEPANKKQRVSFDRSGQWRYAERTPSPAKESPEPEVPRQITNGNDAGDHAEQSQAPHLPSVSSSLAVAHDGPYASAERKSMMPPPLPSLLIPDERQVSSVQERNSLEDRETQGPSTPKINPVSSSTLPLPSPFPAPAQSQQASSLDTALESPLAAKRATTATGNDTADDDNSIDVGNVAESAAHTTFRTLETSEQSVADDPAQGDGRKQLQDFERDNVRGSYKPEDEDDDAHELDRLDAFSSDTEPDTEPGEDLNEEHSQEPFLIPGDAQDVSMTGTDEDMYDRNDDILHDSDVEEVIDITDGEGSPSSDDDNEDIDAEIATRVEPTTTAKSLERLQASKIQQHTRAEDPGESFASQPQTPSPLPPGTSEHGAKSSTGTSPRKQPTPQSEKDRIMAKTFQSLFGFSVATESGQPAREVQTPTRASKRNLSDSFPVSHYLPGYLMGRTGVEESHPSVGPADTAMQSDEVTIERMPELQSDIDDEARTVDEGTRAAPSGLILAPQEATEDPRGPTDDRESFTDDDVAVAPPNAASQARFSEEPKAADIFSISPVADHSPAADEQKIQNTGPDQHEDIHVVHSDYEQLRPQDVETPHRDDAPLMTEIHRHQHEAALPDLRSTELVELGSSSDVDVEEGACSQAILTSAVHSPIPGATILASADISSPSRPEDNGLPGEASAEIVLQGDLMEVDKTVPPETMDVRFDGDEGFRNGAASFEVMDSVPAVISQFASHEERNRPQLLPLAAHESSQISQALELHKHVQDDLIVTTEAKAPAVPSPDLTDGDIKQPEVIFESIREEVVELTSSSPIVENQQADDPFYGGNFAALDKANKLDAIPITTEPFASRQVNQAVALDDSLVSAPTALDQDQEMSDALPSSVLPVSPIDSQEQLQTAEPSIAQQRHSEGLMTIFPPTPQLTQQDSELQLSMHEGQEQQSQSELPQLLDGSQDQRDSIMIDPMLQDPVSISGTDAMVTPQDQSFAIAEVQSTKPEEQPLEVSEIPSRDMPAVQPVEAPEEHDLKISGPQPPEMVEIDVQERVEKLPMPDPPAVTEPAVTEPAVNEPAVTEPAQTEAVATEPPVEQVLAPEVPTDIPVSETVIEVAPNKTPVRRSLRTRLSNVPDVISAWFSPKRSSTAVDKASHDRQQPEILPSPSGASKATGTLANDTATEMAVTEVQQSPGPITRSKKRANGILTSMSYFTPLSLIEEKLNNPSQQAHGSNTVDVFAIVTDNTKDPQRAKSGPRDFFTTFRITDTSVTDNASYRVDVFRPWKATLPIADVGDVMLLRSFVVKSRQRQPYLLSTDASAWCVWRYANARTADENRGKPAWAGKRTEASAASVREEMKGPPVELGDEERKHAAALHAHWAESRESTHDTGSRGREADEAE